MLPAPDFRGWDLLVWTTLLFVPTALGAIATLLAGFAGAEATVHLRKSRYLLATGVGVALGWLLLGSLLCLTFLTFNGLATGFAAVSLASVLASFIAYQAAKVVSTGLNSYRCGVCGASFRSQYPGRQCERCAATGVAAPTNQHVIAPRHLDRGANRRDQKNG